MLSRMMISGVFLIDLKVETSILLSSEFLIFSLTKISFNYKLFELSSKVSKETPLMKQYREIKEKYPDSILFKLEILETFHEDAITTSEFQNCFNQKDLE